MASKANEETVEAKTMRKHYADLTQAIQDPLRLAAKLYSENVIARNVLDSTIESPHTKVEKTMHLLQAVSDQIAINPQDFNCFLTVLKKDPSLQAAAELINSTYSKSLALLPVTCGACWPHYSSHTSLTHRFYNSSTPS